MSPLLLHKVSYVGQLNVYEKSAEILDFLIGFKTNSMQVNKVTNYFGESCAKEDHLLQPIITNIKPTEKVYLMVDGSMVFTKEEGWKEVKLLRIFKSCDCLHIDGKPSRIKHSQYLAQLTDANRFKKEIDKLIENYNIKPEQLIIISDGATWIKNYAEDSFEKSVSMLDYYHAVEYLHQFKLAAFNDENTAQIWVEKQEELLLKSEVEKVIKNIEKIAQETNCKKEAKTIISYYTSNIKRMDYKNYKLMGAGLIGSGAIESAHRTVIQERCKKSGQVWSEDGLQKMLNLRVCYMNNDIGHIKKMATKMAA
jgi:hypothetical protein